jgi:hypothetical protein
MPEERNASELSLALVEAFVQADPRDMKSACVALEAGPDPLEIGRRYASLIRELYGVHKDVTRMLRAAEAGVAFCLSAAKRMSSTNPTGAAALRRQAQVLCYNAAANSWPGWGDEGIAITKEHIGAAIPLAQHGLQLVLDLNLGHRQRGTSHWLVGALFLAAGKCDDALAALTASSQEFHAEGSPPHELLADGYIVLTRRRHRLTPSQTGDLDDICAQLEQYGSQEALAFSKQLRTADRLL